MRRAALALLLAACAATPEPPGPTDPPEEGLVEALLAAHPDRFGDLLANAEALRLQVLVAEVVDGPDDRPVLRRHSFRADAEYFYPASSIKTCAAVAALQELQRHGGLVDLDTPLVFHPLFDDEVLEDADATNRDGGAITVGHEVRKLSIVSDNRAFNRLYELVGHQALNERMWAAGLTSVSVTHRLSEARGYDLNRCTPQVDFGLDPPLLRLEERESPLRLDNAGVPRLLVGERHATGGEVRDGAMDFARKNRVTLRDLQDMLCLIVRPDVDVGLPGFGLTEAHRAFLAEAMRQTPAESENPVYDPPADPGYYKALWPGLARVVPEEHLDVWSKIGVAYGFTIENDYVVDHRTGRAFFVAVTIYTNPNGVVNDGDYAYATVADPFLAELGEVLARRFLAPDRAP